MWTPVGVVNDLELAAAMADLVREDEVGAEVSVVSADELLHVFRSQDREHILGRLDSRTISDIQRELTLRHAAEARLRRRERRTGLDRRSVSDRRSGVEWMPREDERRSGGERRSRHDRRTQTAPV
jgi:hypothetical protein